MNPYITKKTILCLCIFFFAYIITSTSHAQVSVSPNGADPHPAAVLDLISNNKGVLIPRIESTEARDAIPADSESESLMIFNMETYCFETYVSGHWHEFWCFDEVCEESTEPTGISGNDEICEGGNTDLSVEGGELGSIAEWMWYTGGCGNDFVDEGELINVSPSSNTIYYVRAEGHCGTTDCVSLEVTVEALPEDPTSLTANPSTIDLGESSTLSYSGGSGDTFVWYTGSCGGTQVGTGNNHTVTPDETTTYYGRWETDNCGESDCLPVEVTVEETASCDPVFPCPGEEGGVSHDGFTYNTVQIGDQCWMIENLRTTTGITYAPSDSEWNDAGNSLPYEPAYCEPDPDSENSDGYLYNWFAANDNPCPFGWRVPTQSDYETLVDNANLDGDNLKDEAPFWNGTNECGWAGRQGNYRAPSGTFWPSNSDDGFWWTTSSAGGGNYVDFRLYNSGGYQINQWGSPSGNGAYIRCIKD